MGKVTQEMREKLKSTVFDNGLEGIEDFLGYEIDENEDKDVTDNRMDIAINEMSDAQFFAAYLSWVK
jgi:hypothetical protein